MEKLSTHQSRKKQISLFLRSLLALFVTGLFCSMTAYGQSEVRELPLFMKFDNYIGVNISELSEGWYEATNQPPQGTSGGWYQSEVLYDDIHAAIELYSNTHREWIISPRFYATENTQVSFEASVTYAHDEPREGSFGGDDEFTVMVSTDGGNNFSPLYKFTNSSSKQLEYDFKRFTFQLDEYSGSNIQIGFFASDGSQEDGAFALHLDDIEIKNQKAKDAFAFDILKPQTNNCFSSQQDIVVQVKNEGYESLTNIPVKVKIRDAVTENIFNVASGPVMPGDTAEVKVGTFDMSAFGTYEFSLQTELDEDEFRFNDELNKTVMNEKVFSLPLEKLTFSTSYGEIGKYYEGWKEYRGESYPMVEMNTDWQSDDYKNEPGVSVYFSNVGTIDWLVSPKFQPTADTKMSFDYALALEDGVTGMGSDDQMNIMVTTDCGKTWTEIDEITADSDVSTNWNDYVVDLSQFEGETIQIAFYAYTGSNNDSEQYLFFLDNIDIREMYVQDVGVTKLTSPGAPAEFTTDETISVMVENFGTTEAVDFEIAYQINDNSPVVETITTPVPPKEKVEYTFAQTADLTQQEENSIDVYTQMDGDGNPENDGIYDRTLETASFDPGTEGTFSVSFEENEDLSGWFVVNHNNDEAEWELIKDPANAYEGDYAYEYNSNGTVVQSDDWLFSPAIELVKDQTYYVSFYFSNAAGNYPEKLRLSLASSQHPDSVTRNLIDLGEIDNNEFLKAEIEFVADSTGKFHMGFQNYGAPDQQGMHLDNIELRKVFSDDIQVTDLQIPRQKNEATGQLMDIDTAYVKVNNPGLNTADAFTVNLAYNKEDTLSQSYSAQNLIAGDQKIVVFDQNLNLSKEQVYDFEVWTEYGADQNVANDTFRLKDFYLKHYQTSFEANEDLSGWKTVDAAGENYSWEIIDDDTKAHSGTRCYQLPSSSYDPNLTENDDWLFSEGFYLEADKCYKVGFWYNAYFSEEKLTFMLGQEQNTSMKDTLINFGVIGTGTKEEWRYTEIAVSVQETGEYFFGWHADGSLELSRYRLLIDDFELQQNFDFEPTVSFTYKQLDTEYFFESTTENVEWLEWNFDDGSYSEEENPFHTFESTGSYNVHLAAGNACAADTATQTIDLTCDVTSSFSYTIEDQTVTFTNNSENASGFLWKFGDDSVSTEKNPVHSYEENGEYTVSLQAIGACGENISEQVVTVDTTATSVRTGMNQQNLRVYPNPVSGIVNLSVNPGQKIATIEIKSISGQMILRKDIHNLSQTRIDLTHLKAGTYIIRVTTQNGDIINKKITKQ